MKPNRKSRIFTKRGYGLIEIVVGSAIIATVLVGAVFAVNSVRELDRKTTAVIRANYLLLEAIDVMKIYRDISWSSNIASLTQNTSYYLVWDSGAWEATTTPSVIDGRYHRTVELDSVNRDVNDNIATAGSLDTGTLKVIASISWFDRDATTTKEFETYITDLYGN